MPFFFGLPSLERQVSMSKIAIPRAQDLADLTAKILLADYVGAKLHLYSNDFTPSVDTILADFTECIYTGYAAIAVTWSAPFYDQNNIPVSSIGELLFVQTGIVATDNCFGVFLTNAAGAKLLWSARLDAPPFNFNRNGDALPITAQMGIDDGTVLQSVGP